MTAAPLPYQTDHTAQRFRSPVGFRWLFAALIIGITTVILVGHGCHGDDVDHEPAVPWDVRSESS
jgi:hypothetical protein